MLIENASSICWAVSDREELIVAEGAHVVVNDINKDGAVSVSQAIIDAGGSAMAICADVSNSAQVKEMFDRTLERFCALDILVNNAGIVSPMLHFLDKDGTPWWWNHHKYVLGWRFTRSPWIHGL